MTTHDRPDTSIEGLELAYAEALGRAKEAEAKARSYHNLLVDWRQYFRWRFAISTSGELAYEDELESLIERTKAVTQ
jgi:hypothetical protein